MNLEVDASGGRGPVVGSGCFYVQGGYGAGGQAGESQPVQRADDGESGDVNFATSLLPASQVQDLLYMLEFQAPEVALCMPDGFPH